MFDVLVLQNSVVVVQKNGKERQRQSVLHVQFVFLLIDLDAIFRHYPPRLALQDLIFFVYNYY